MTTGTHDPALCHDQVCSECDAYGSVYSAGKAKAFAAVRDLLDGGGHAESCGCEPCRIVRDESEVAPTCRALVHAQLRTWQLGDHEPSCGCANCETVRVIFETIVLAGQQPVLLPDSHIEGCEGLRVCSSCGCWCHRPGPIDSITA